MWLGKRRDYKDEQERISALRQKYILYKKFFESDDGKEILTDLMNRYSLVFDFKNSVGVSAERRLGQNDVLAYILTLTESPMAQFDKIVKGDNK